MTGYAIYHALLPTGEPASGSRGNPREVVTGFGFPREVVTVLVELDSASGAPLTAELAADLNLRDPWIAGAISLSELRWASFDLRRSHDFLMDGPAWITNEEAA